MARKVLRRRPEKSSEKSQPQAVRSNKVALFIFVSLTVVALFIFTFNGGYKSGLPIKIDPGTLFINYTIEKTTQELYNSTGKQGGGFGWNTSAMPLLQIRADNGEDDAFILPNSRQLELSCRGKMTDTIFIHESDATRVNGLQYFRLYWQDANDGGKAKFCYTGATLVDGPQLKSRYKNQSVVMSFYVRKFANNSEGTNGIEMIVAKKRSATSYASVTGFNSIYSTAPGAMGFEDGFGLTPNAGAHPRNIYYYTQKIFIGNMPRDFITLEGMKVYNPKFYGDARKAKFGLPSEMK